MSENDYLNMPAPFRSKMNLRTDYKMQIAVVKTGESLFTVLKHYTFESKTPSLKNVQDMVYGEPYLIDFSPCYKYGPLALQLMLERMSTWIASYHRITGKPKEEKRREPSDLQVGFDYIRKHGPRTNIGNQQTEWAEIEVNRPQGPLTGWSSGLVKECLRGHSNSVVFSTPITDYYLTLHDVAGWFLDDVLMEILGDLQSKTLVFMGFAEKGKTPVAEAISMALSEYYILKENINAHPSFRLCSSLDQLRGESGCKERPDILDDPDTSQVPISKLKSFLDSTLVETHTVERWTASRFVQHQLRIICDNRVNEDAEPQDEDLTEIPFNAFLDMITPAFADKCGRQDMMACLKRAHWIVNMKYGVYLRRAGTCTDPVRRIHYTDGIQDFLSPEGRKVIGHMRAGNKSPPVDWADKRQWSHDLITMLMESDQKPPRTMVIIEQPSPFDSESEPTRRETKPTLPFSGRVCQAHFAQVAQARPPSQEAPRAPAMLVKEEIPDSRAFPGLLSGSAEPVDLCTPSTPSPARRAVAATSSSSRKRARSSLGDDMDVASNDSDIMPAVGEPAE